MFETIKTVFFSALMSLTLVRFDTQDNIYLESFAQEWVNQENPDGTPAGVYSLKRELINGKNGMRFKSTGPVKAVRLNNFPYRYKVKKISAYEFEITSHMLPAYFNEKDIIDVVVKKH